MSDTTPDIRGTRLAETIQLELAARGLSGTLSARYDPSVGAVLVGPVVLEVERQHEVYYPITLECSAIVEDVVRRREEDVPTT